MTIWLFSDPHFWHDNIYRFVYTDRMGIERRVREKFATCAEGDAYMLDRWAALVKPADHIWCLGDVCMERGNHRRDEFIAMIRKLPGHKRLILGNHDHYKCWIYAEAGFDKIRASNVLEELLLTHYPVHPGSISHRVVGNAHGHIHQNPSPPGPYVNLSVEATNYEPVPIEVVKEQLKAKLGDEELAFHLGEA